jgi:hypothetical protein
MKKVITRTELKNVITESLLEALNTPTNPPGEWDTKPLSKSDVSGYNPEYERARGRKVGVQDKISGKNRDLSQYSADFQKGYKEVHKDGFWSRFNDRMTQWLANMGSSLIKR